MVSQPHTFDEANVLILDEPVGLIDCLVGALGKAMLPGYPPKIVVGEILKVHLEGVPQLYNPAPVFLLNFVPMRKYCNPEGCIWETNDPR